MASLRFCTISRDLELISRYWLFSSSETYLNLWLMYKLVSLIKIAEIHFQKFMTHSLYPSEVWVKWPFRLLAKACHLPHLALTVLFVLSQAASFLEILTLIIYMPLQQPCWVPSFLDENVLIPGRILMSFRSSGEYHFEYIEIKLFKQTGCELNPD